MTSDESPRRRVKIAAELVVEITDQAALARAALADVEASEFLADSDQSADDAKAAQRESGLSDPVAAVAWMAAIAGILPEDLPGVDIVEGICETEEIGEGGLPIQHGPDFAALFAPCRCGKRSCDTCSGFQLTPRTASALWTAAQILADQAYDDVQEYGDAPVPDENGWLLFGCYPRITWAQDAVWRRQAARAFDDLAADLEEGQWPRPRSPGEEMALHLILEDAVAAVEDGWAEADDQDAELPAHTDDFEWDVAADCLFQDTDLLNLFDPNLDGIEDPEAELNVARGIGDYRPRTWFAAFENMTPRDGRRPFRR